MSYEQDEAMILAGDASIARGRFKDTGCSLHPACLTCPRPTCIYDEEAQMAETHNQLLVRERKARVLEMWGSGLNGPSIAAQMHLAHRTVYRYIAEARALGAA